MSTVYAMKQGQVGCTEVVLERTLRKSSVKFS